jgi:hypothetical protein
MHERDHGEESYRPAEVREHPKPPPGGVDSLNQAIRQELWYLDTLVAMPFRTVRRALGARGGRSAVADGLDELLWAAEGMSRLPVKVLQSAFGEDLGKKPGRPQGPDARRVRKRVKTSSGHREGDGSRRPERAK